MSDKAGSWSKGLALAVTVADTEGRTKEAQSIGGEFGVRSLGRLPGGGSFGAALKYQPGL